MAEVAGEHLVAFERRAAGDGVDIGRQPHDPRAIGLVQIRGVLRFEEFVFAALFVDRYEFTDM